MLYPRLRDPVLRPEFVQRFFSFFWDLTAAMSRRRTGTDAIGNHKVENVEAFESSRGVCGDDLIVLPIAGDAAVRDGKAYQMVCTESFYARAGIAAQGRRRRSCLHLDGVKNVTVQSAAERASFRLKVKGDAGLGVHRMHLRDMFCDSVLIGLSSKLNNKAKAQDFLLDSLTA